MKLFKIDEYKLYERYFQHMKVVEFLSLDNIPRGVEPEQLKNIRDFTLSEKRNFIENKLGFNAEGLSDEEEFDNMTLEEVLIRRLVESGDIDLEEAYNIKLDENIKE